MPSTQTYIKKIKLHVIFLIMTQLFTHLTINVSIFFKQNNKLKKISDYQTTQNSQQGIPDSYYKNTFIINNLIYKK